jgi:hypothetical protein
MTEIQKNNVANLSKEDLKELLDICIEELGVIDIAEARLALCVSRQRIYQIMNEKNTLIIGKHKFLMINW